MSNVNTPHTQALNLFNTGLFGTILLLSMNNPLTYAMARYFDMYFDSREKITTCGEKGNEPLDAAKTSIYTH